MQMRRFDVTVHYKSYTEKPGQTEVASHIRKLTENQIQSVNVYELAAIFGRGQSVVLGVHNLQDKLNNYTSKKTFLYQEAFSVDIDHGNFTLDELKERLAELPFSYSLIYKTFSYEEVHNKRWRVVFLAHKRYTDADQVSYINRYLVYMMAKDFKKHGDKWLKKIDTQSTDCSRINFGGEIAFLEPHTLANFDLILNSEYERQVEQFERELQSYKSLYKEPKPTRGRKIIETPKNTLKTAENSGGQPKIPTFADDIVAMCDQIRSNLAILAYALPNKPDYLDVRERFSFIDTLPLSMLLDVKIRQNFHCILPSHIDNNPSANLMLSNNPIEEVKTERYYCFGCMAKGTYHKTFGLISTMFEAAYGFTPHITAEVVCEILNIKVGSKYKTQTQRQIEHDINFFNSLPKDEPLWKKLNSKNAVYFYEGFLKLAREHVPYESMLVENESKDMVFFASNTYIQYHLEHICQIEGVKNISSVNRKLNYLVSLGLVEKVPYEELKPSLQEKSKDYIRQIKQREAKELGNHPYRNPDYYRLRFLTSETVRRATELIEFNRLHAGRARGQSAKQLKALYGEDRAKEVHLQSSLTYDTKETRFLEEARTQISEFLNDRGYFTEKELLRRIDTKNRYSNKKTKETLSLRLLPELLNEFKLIKVPVNKKYRNYYEIPEKIKSGQHIMFHEAVYEMLKKS